MQPRHQPFTLGRQPGTAKGFIPIPAAPAELPAPLSTGRLQKQLIKIKRGKGKLAIGRVPTHGCWAPSRQLQTARALLLPRFRRCQ